MKLFSSIGSFSVSKKKRPNINTNVTKIDIDPLEKLKETLELLDKRETFLEEKCQKELAEAKKKLLIKNKKGAVICLKRKAGYLAQIEKIGSTRANIEQQLMVMENAKINVEAMAAMQLGAKTMQKIHKNMDIDQVDDTIMDIQEQMNVSNQISEAIAQPMGNSIYDDDDELLEELDLLEQEYLDEQLFGLEQLTTPSTSIPLTSTTTAKATSTKATLSKDNDEDELRQLEAEMAI